MWKMTPEMERALRQEHTVATKIVLLDTRLREVEGGVIFDAEETNELTNFITDGQIDVDTTRGTRRTAEVTLLNPTSEFTPSTGDFSPDGPWVGKVYLNRIVRIYRGVRIQRQSHYVPVGTFMIDVADVLSQQNMSQVVLTMSDFWKKLTKSTIGYPKTYPDDTLYETIIRDFLAISGADEPLAPNIDNLNNRPAAERRTNGKLSFSEGESRGERLKELAAQWNLDMYFDPMGRFVSQDRRDAKDKAVVWRFYSSPTKDGMLVSVKRSFNDDNLYNHVIVLGGDEKNRIREWRWDKDPRSKSNIDLIGDRVFLIENDKIKTVAQARAALSRAWKIRFQLSETVEIETISNPALEGDDVIRITEKEKAKIDFLYRVTRFTVPLITARQVIHMSKIIYEDDL